MLKSRLFAFNLLDFEACKFGCVSACNGKKDIQSPRIVGIRVDLKSAIVVKDFSNLDIVQGQQFVAVCFIGKGSIYGLEGNHITSLWEKVKDFNPTYVGFLGCDLGSSRTGPTILLTHSKKMWGQTIGLAYDQKVTWDMVVESGIIDTFTQFIYFCNSIDVNMRQLVRYIIACVFKRGAKLERALFSMMMTI